MPASIDRNRPILIAGGGPAGMMLGFLLARAGIPVTVLEKHADFFRDFRGDTIHTATLELLRELGLLEDFLKLPHQKVGSIGLRYGNHDLQIGDFTRLPVAAKFVAFMPQWDFLNFLTEQGRRHAVFDLRLGWKAQTLLFDAEGRVSGLQARDPAGMKHDLPAALVVACDGRHSELRTQSRLVLDEIGAPIDVLWYRLPRRTDDPAELLGRITRGRMMILINRGDYYQCASVIAKGGFERLKERGLAIFQAEIARLAPFLADRVATLQDWDDVKLLNVQLNRLRRWHRPGLLCIGDAAHAMSPVGGVGINLAIQDAVAAANILWRGVSGGRVLDVALLAEVQKRRDFPTRIVQGFQAVVHRQVAHTLLDTDMASGPAPVPPWPLRLLDALPVLRGLPARFIALGPRREHIRTPEVSRLPRHLPGDC